MSWLQRGRVEEESRRLPKGRTIEHLLGHEVLVRRYKDCPQEMVIRKVKLHDHIHHLRIERKDLNPQAVQESFTASWTGKRGPYGVWEADHKEIFIYDDWQLRNEMRYGFTTNPRWDEPPKLEMERLEEAVELNEWTFAKTMAYNPHWYALRRKWDASAVAFDDFVWMIRGHGYTQVYQNANYRCLNVGSHFYWTMGAPFMITTLINRKPLP